jgi:hypothetical protein
LVEGCCVTIEENENDVGNALVAPIVVVGLIIATTIVVDPLATITSQNFYLLKIILNLTF